MLLYSFFSPFFFFSPPPPPPPDSAATAPFSSPKDSSGVFADQLEPALGIRGEAVQWCHRRTGKELVPSQRQALARQGANQKANLTTTAPVRPAVCVGRRE